MLRINIYKYINSILKAVYNDKDPKFGDYVRIVLHKATVKITVPWTYEIENGA